MDVRVSALLLLTFLTAGHALRCYTCTSLAGICDATVQTCSDGNTNCATMFIGPVMSKGCVPNTCTNQNQQYTSIKCCGTDLCNSADGMYRGSVLLLFSPLLFYFLFQ